MEISVNAVSGYPAAGWEKEPAAAQTGDVQEKDYAVVTEEKRKERDGETEQEPLSFGQQERTDPDRARERLWEEKKTEARRLSRRRRAKKEARVREQQRRQIKYERELKRKRRARYVRIMEESSWKRKLESQESIRNYYQSEVSAEVVSFIVADRSVTQGRTEGCIRCTFAGNEPDQLNTVFFTYYSPDGLFCIREGERNPSNPNQKLTVDVLQWEIPLEDEGQYEAVSKYLAGLPEGEDFSFAAREEFWREFLGLPR